MLIYLTNSLIVKDSDERLDDIKRCAKYLALAMIEQNHLVRGDYEVLEWLSNVMVGDDRDSVKVYSRLYKRYSTYVVPTCLHFYVKVTLDMPVDDVLQNGDVYIKPVQYSYFLSSSKVQAMPFIGEDSADCLFYNHIAAHYLAKGNIKLNLKMRHEKGNGSGIASATTEYVKGHLPVISIIDTDKKYPTQPIDPNSTYAKCKAVWPFYPKINEIYSFLVINTQEIENLIPYNYIVGLGVWDGQNAANKATYDKFYNSPNRETILCFFDLKNGMKKCTAMNTEPDYLDYTVMCYSCIDSSCTNESVKAMSNKTELCMRLHSKLLKLTNEYVTQHTNLQPQLLLFQEREWNRIGSFLLDMCCAGKEEFV